MVFNGHLNELDSYNIMLVWLFYTIWLSVEIMYKKDSLVSEWRIIILTELLYLSLSTWWRSEECVVLTEKQEC